MWSSSVLGNNLDLTLNFVHCLCIFAKFWYFALFDPPPLHVLCAGARQWMDLGLVAANITQLCAQQNNKTDVQVYKHASLHRHVKQVRLVWNTNCLQQVKCTLLLGSEPQVDDPRSCIDSYRQIKLIFLFPNNFFLNVLEGQKWSYGVQNGRFIYHKCIFKMPKNWSKWSITIKMMIDLAK